MKKVLATALLPLLCVSSSPLLAKSLGENLDEAALKMKLNAQYSSNALIDANNVKVSVDGDKVKLTGVVDSKLAFHESIRYAQEASGIYDVNVDDLFIKGHESYMKDLSKEVKISGKCLAKKANSSSGFTYTDLSVEVHGDTAYICASVPNRAVATQMEKLVAETEGIKHVKSHITAKA